MHFALLSLQKQGLKTKPIKAKNYSANKIRYNGAVIIAAGSPLVLLSILTLIDLYINITI